MLNMQLDHRPWPVPPGPWIMHMTWNNLLFAHWPVHIEQLRPHVPLQLPIDTYDGQAWLAIVPFTMTNVRPRFIPPLPYFSAFPELNVRTYITMENKPGIWFFSLEAARLLAVIGAKMTYHLPYYHAAMSARIQNNTV